MEVPEHYLGKEVKCVSCGAKLEAVEKVEAPKIKETKSCQECGAEISKKAVVCPKCGVPTEDKKQKQRESRSNPLRVLGLLFIVASIVLGYLGYLQMEPTESEKRTESLISQYKSSISEYKTVVKYAEALGQRAEPVPDDWYYGLQNAEREYESKVEEREGKMKMYFYIGGGLFILSLILVAIPSPK